MIEQKRKKSIIIKCSGSISYQSLPTSQPLCVCMDRDDTNECARARFFQDDDDEKVDNYSIYPHDEDWIFFLSFSLIHTQSLSFFFCHFFPFIS